MLTRSLPLGSALLNCGRSLLLVAVIGSSGCGSPVVTNAPVSAEESHELEQQRTQIEQQLARDAKSPRRG